MASPASQTTDQMVDQGWFIWSVCGRCYLAMEVDLGILEHTLGAWEPGGTGNRRAVALVVRV